VVEAEVSPPPVRRRLAAVWTILLVLVAVIVLLEWLDRKTSEETVQHVSRMLLPAPIEQLGAVEIAVRATLHRFEREASGAWFYHGIHTGTEGSHEHQIDPDASRRIGRALAALGRAKIEREFPLVAKGAGFGVTTPAMIVLVYRPNEQKPVMQYAVGDIAPDTISRYVWPVGADAVVTIPNYQIDNLLQLVEASAGSAASARPDALQATQPRQ
jgi:hypothetical protein